MDLTKKSASDIERINKYKRVISRFMKELGLYKYWLDYLRSKEYEEFAVEYEKNNPYYSQLWYDRESCIMIVGCCSLDKYIEHKLSDNYNKFKKQLSHYYLLLFAFIQIFWPSEFKRYNETRCDGESKFNYRDFAKVSGHFEANMIDKWLKEKEIFGGYED